MMKKILFILLLGFLSFGIQAQGSNMTVLSVDGCCVTYLLTLNGDIASWTLFPDFDDQSVSYTGVNADGLIEITHCFGDVGNYISWFDKDGNGNTSSANVVDCDPCAPCDDIVHPSFTYSTNGCTVSICDIDLGSYPACFDEAVYDLDMGDGTSLDPSTDLCDESSCSSCPPCDEVTLLSTINTFGNEKVVTLIESFSGELIMGSNRNGENVLSYFDTGGNLLWAKSMDFTPYDDFLQHLSVNAGGDIIGVGFGLIPNTGQKINYAFKYNYLTASLIWSNKLENVPTFSTYKTIVEKTGNGDYFVMGDRVNSAGDALIIELDRNTGAKINEYNYSLGGYETIEKAVAYNNHFYVTGTYTASAGIGKTRSAISKIDFSGNEIWSRLYLKNTANVANINTSDILIESNAIYALSYGSLNSTSSTNVTFHLQQNDLNGNLIWAKAYNVTNAVSERPTSLVSTTNGFLISGYITAQGNNSYAFITKVNKSGVIQWSKRYDFTTYIPGNLAPNLVLKDDFIYLSGHTAQNIMLVKLDLYGNLIGECACDANLTMTEQNIINPYYGIHALTPYNYGDSIISTNTLIQDLYRQANICAEECSGGSGNGGSSSGMPMGHTYACNGKYEVCLTSQITDISENVICVEEACEDVVITDCGYCCECNVPNPTIIVNQQNCMVSISTDEGNVSCQSANYTWFVDGMLVSSGSTATHTFTQGGSHNICLTLTEVNAQGEACSVTNCTTVTIADCGDCQAGDCRDYGEPNNSFSTAVDGGRGGLELRVCLSSSDDIDYYKIEAGYVKVSAGRDRDCGGYILYYDPFNCTIETRGRDGQEIDTHIELYDSNFNLIASDDNSGQGNLSFLTYNCITSGDQEFGSSSTPEIYPNPAQAQFQIKYQLPEPINTAQLQLINLQGQVIWAQNVQDTYIDQTVNVADFAAGIYFLYITGDTMPLEQTKIVIQ